MNQVRKLQCMIFSGNGARNVSYSLIFIHLDINGSASLYLGNPSNFNLEKTPAWDEMRVVPMQCPHIQTITNYLLTWHFNTWQCTKIWSMNITNCTSALKTKHMTKAHLVVANSPAFFRPPAGFFSLPNGPILIGFLVFLWRNVWSGEVNLLKSPDMSRMLPPPSLF